MINLLNKIEWTAFLKSGRTKKLVCTNCENKIVKARSEFVYDHNSKYYSFKPKNFDKIENGNFFCFHCGLLLGLKTTEAFKAFRPSVKLIIYENKEQIMTIE